MKLMTVCGLIAAAVFTFVSGQSIAADAPFEGRKKCSSCHKAQAQSWKDTAHAKAMESLKPNVKTEAKQKAKLDPAMYRVRDRAGLGHVAFVPRISR